MWSGETYGGVIMSDINNVQAAGGKTYSEAESAVNAVKTVAAPKGEKKVSVAIAEVDGKSKEAAANGFNKNTVKNAIDTANDSLKTSRTSARFKYHETTKQVSIKIIDDATQEVIKEIPPEKSIEMVEKMLELSGILVDEKR